MSTPLLAFSCAIHRELPTVLRFYRSHGTSLTLCLQDVITRYENLVLAHNAYVKEHDNEDATLNAYHQREKMLTTNINTLQSILVR